MDRQNIFDRVLDHLRVQGVASVQNFEGRCAYRGEQDQACAIGVLIPSGMYCLDMEGFTARSLLQRFTPLMDILGVSREEDIGFLHALQAAHDLFMPRAFGHLAEPVFSLGKWEEEMQTIAHRYGLQYRSRDITDNAKDVAVEALAQAAVTQGGAECLLND